MGYDEGEFGGYSTVDSEEPLIEDGSEGQTIEQICEQTVDVLVVFGETCMPLRVHSSLKLK